MHKETTSDIRSKPWCDLQILERKVVKKQDKNLASTEIAKTKRGALIGQNTQLYRVPEIIKISDDGYAIEFERIHGLMSVSEYIKSHTEAHWLLETIGKSLGEIHRNLKLPTNLSRYVDSQFLYTDKDTYIYLHGDFNTINVQVISDTKELVILDWATSHIFDKSSTIGPFYLDLFFFIHTLFFGRITDRFLCSTKRTVLLADAFITGYFSSSMHQYNSREIVEVFGIYYRLMYDRHAKEKGQLRFALYKSNFKVFRQYIEAL